MEHKKGDGPFGPSPFYVYAVCAKSSGVITLRLLTLRGVIAPRLFATHGIITLRLAARPGIITPRLFATHGIITLRLAARPGRFPSNSDRARAA